MQKLLASILTCIAFSLNAQYVKTIIEDADSHFINENFNQAYNDYHYVSTIFPEKSAEIEFKLKVSFYLSEGRNIPPNELLSMDVEKEELDFWLGRVYYESYDFKSAINYFEEFKRNSSGDENRMVIANNLIEKANYILSQPENTDWVLQQLSEPYNSKFAEVSPTISTSSNQLLFFSSRPIEDLYDQNQYHLFQSNMTGKKTASSVIVDRKLGNFDLLNSKICLDKNENLYFNNKLFSNVIYTAKLSDPNWQDHAVAFVELQDELSFDSHFFVSKNADRILFSAETDGQVDIYEIKLEQPSGVWSTPKMLSFNTKHNEDSPFLSNSGETLYFSSDRPQSFGGYDVYSAQLDPVTGEWKNPVNMGYPINTIDDDIDFSLDRENQTGFITSDRKESLGEYDIFLLTRTSDKEQHPFNTNGPGISNRRE